jgi:CheY-like chemotaxis protein
METYFKILCVDDEKLFVELIKLMLNEKLFEIDDAYNGGEAVTKAFENKYDIILMDINMPEMDGIVASQTIRKMLPNIPIISISAYDASDMKGSEVFTENIRKPISRNSLRDLILKVLNYEEKK